MTTGASRLLPPGIPSHLGPVLDELSSGTTDLAASKRLRMSPRTYSRRVCELLEHLGVETRFQAGAELARLGWVWRRTAGPPVTSAPDLVLAGVDDDVVAVMAGGVVE